MKKLFVVIAFFAIFFFVSCGSSKSEPATDGDSEILMKMRQLIPTKRA